MAMAAMAMVASVAAAGCGSTPARPATRSSPSAARLRGPLTVFAAASLTEAFDDTEKALVADNPGLALTYSFAGSQQLVTQVGAGAPADVVATADEASMAKLAGAGLVDPPRIFARNKLAIVVARANPKGVAGLGDLAAGGVAVILADPSVPAGRYAQQALERAGVTVHPVSMELDVKAVLAKVASGEADAGIVYATDVVAAGNTVTGIEIPDEANVVARYPAAVVRATPNRDRAQAFVDQLVDGAGQASLRARGFLAP